MPDAGESTPTSGFDCQVGYNLKASCVPGDATCPRRGVRTLDGCRALCVALRSCAGVVFNSYQQCFLKRQQRRLVFEGDQHGTISCVRIRDDEREEDRPGLRSRPPTPLPASPTNLTKPSHRKGHMTGLAMDDARTSIELFGAFDAVCVLCTAHWCWKARQLFALWPPSMRNRTHVYNAHDIDINTKVGSADHRNRHMRVALAFGWILQQHLPRGETTLILEGDFTVVEQPPLSIPSAPGFHGFVRSDDWRVLRLGYNPDTDASPATSLSRSSTACPRSCHCHLYGFTWIHTTCLRAARLTMVVHTY